MVDIEVPGIHSEYGNNEQRILKMRILLIIHWNVRYAAYCSFSMDDIVRKRIPYILQELVPGTIMGFVCCM